MTNSQQIKENNINEIFQIIKKEKAISRVEIAQKMNLSQTSVGRSVLQLIEAGYVMEGENVGNTVGRQRVLLHVVPKRALAIGVFLSSERIDAGLVDVAGNILLRNTCDPEAADGAGIVEKIRACVDALLAQMEPQDRDHLVGIGVTLPGTINYKSGTVVHSAHFNLHNFNLGSALKANYPYTIVVDSSVCSCVKMQQFTNSAKNAEEFLVVSLGEEISMSLMINGKIARGPNNCAGELGHVIVNPNGALCECGRRGCLQTVISRGSVEKELGMSFQDAVKGYDSGNEKCTDVLNRLVSETALWIVNVMYIFNPMELILTGSMIDDWEPMFDLISAGSRRLMGDYFVHNNVIKRNRLGGEDGNIVSAASNIFYKFKIRNGENYFDYLK